MLTCLESKVLIQEMKGNRVASLWGSHWGHLQEDLSNSYYICINEIDIEIVIVVSSSPGV